MKKTILSWIDRHLEEIVLFPGLSFLVIGLGVEVFRRYVLRSPGPYTAELATFTFVWVVYIGVPYAVRNNTHITLDLLPEDMSRRTDTILRVVARVIQLGFFVFIAVQALRLISFNRMVNVVSDAMAAPLWIVLLCFPVGFALGAVRLVQDLVKILRERKP